MYKNKRDTSTGKLLPLSEEEKESNRVERRNYLRDWQRKYRQTNRETVREASRTSYANTMKDPVRRDAHRKYMAEWQAKRRADSAELREKERGSYAKWYAANADKKRAYAKYWSEKNAERRRVYQREYLHNKRKDPQFRMIQNARVRINTALSERGLWKKGRTVELLGIDTKQLASYLESKFLPGMTWENRGEWHIDHIIPLAAFDLTNEHEQRRAFHYTNLQPLWARDNLKKGKKLQ
jgi:hypothetical protein